MKTITNILSYLWLLLLMAVTACSDLEEEVGPMKGEEEVELTIRTQVPGMKVGTRAAETENLTTITALVFNAEKELIKKVDNIVASTTDGTQGTFTLKVPLRTRSIHFIGNLPNDVTLPDVGDSEDELKSITTSGNMSYWGYASFADVAALRAYKNQTLYRNKAKISIAGTFNGSLAIAGLENVYKKGVLVPHNGDEFNFDLTNYDYQTLPTSVSNEEKGQEKYELTVTETYVFEHPNDEGNALFAICLINNKYYKVALAKNNSGTLSYYDIIRNHQYRIKINAINESLGQDFYDYAVNSDPINNAEAEVEVTKDAVLTIESISANELVYNAGNKQLSMTVNIPEGVSALTINAPNFTASTTNGNLSSTSTENNTFNVNSAGSVTFTLKLKDDDYSRGQQETISVQGTAKEGYSVTNDSKTIILKEQVSLQTSLLEGVNSLMYSNEENSESDLIVNVTIPAGVTTLNFESEYFDLISVNGRTKTENEVSTPYISVSNDGYSVNHQGESSLTLPFRLRLKDDKKAPTSSAGFTFDGSGEGVKVVPATMSNITLTENDDENVRWQGDVLLDWGNEGAVTQIPLPYSWFEGLSPGSTLRVDYQVTDADKSEKDRDAVIQFTEVKGDSWTDSPYDFAELKENDGEDAGVNLSKDTQSGSIYDINGVIELNLTQTILEKMVQNKTTFDGLENIVMAIQGGNVRLKKISVIPNNQADNDQLDITLDFYALDANSQKVDRDDERYTDLQLGTSRFVLEVTIDDADAQAYNGQTVYLAGDFETIAEGANQNGWAIRWDQSKTNGAINYLGNNNNGSGLQFQINGNNTYLIEWVFKTGQHYKGGDIGFTYNISNYAISGVDGTFNNFAGDTSATIGFTNEPIYLDVYSDADTDDGNDISIVSGSQLVMKAIVPSDITKGTITFNLSGSTGDIMSGITWNDRAGQSVQFSWPNITLTVVENQRDYYLYWNPTVSDERSATLNFTVSGNYNLNSVGNTSYSKAITVSRTVIDDEDFSNFKNVGPGSVSVEDGILCLTNNTDRQNAWDAQAMYETNGIEYGETYTLTFKAKIANNTQGEMAVAIQRFENGECVATDHYRIFTINDINNAKKENQDWAEFTYDITIQDNNQETPNENNPTHFMFNFGDLVGTLYIDDLSLVKKN